MKLHDISPTIPTWVEEVARAWYYAYRNQHMPMVYNAANNTLAYVWGGTNDPDPISFMNQEFWADWRRVNKAPKFDLNWVRVI